MQAQASLGIWEFVLFWVFTGSSLLGLPPGERDASLLKAVPPQTLAYFEWASRGQGQAGAAGIDGFAADPEIRQFFEMLDAAVAKREVPDDEDSLKELRSEWPQLVKWITAHPGCLFIGFEPRPENKNVLEGLINHLKGLHGGVILSLGSDAQATWASLVRSFKSIPGFVYDESSTTQSIPVSIPGYKLVVHREGERIIFALGEGTLVRVLDGLTGKLPGLDTNPRFLQATTRVSIPRIATVGWVDCQGIIGSVTAALGPLGGIVRPVLTLVGAESLDHVVQCSGVENGSMIQRTFVATGGRTTGVMAVAAGQPITPQNFSHVPADADLVLAASISLKNVYLEARQTLAKTRPLSVRVFDEAVKQMESELELKIVDDVLPAFGDVVTAFDSPTAGGMVATSLVACLEVRDPRKAAVVFSRLVKLAEQSLASEHGDGYEEPTTLRRQTFLGHEVYYVTNPGQGYGVHLSITPSFCLTDRHVLFAIHPQAMKAHLRYLDSRQPGSVEAPRPGVVDAPSPESVVVAARPRAGDSGRPSFEPQAFRKVSIPNGDVLAYAYLNGPRANGIASALLPFLSPTFLMKLEVEGLTMDSFSIPSAAAISPYFGDSTAVITRQKDGLLSETRNAPPVIVSMGLLSVYRTWHSTDFEMIEDARRRKDNGVDQARLGPANDGVVPAVAEKQAASVPDEKSKPSAYRKLAPIFLKALIPDDIQPLIPESALKKLEEGPSAATVQQREEARLRREQRRDDARKKREERRTGRPLPQ